MVYVQRIFKKEITIQIESYAEKKIDDVVQCVKNYITESFYGCDTKIVEGKLIIETDKVQAKAQIEYCKQKIKSLYREKERTNKTSYRLVLDKDIEEEKAEIRKFENLLLKEEEE